MQTIGILGGIASGKSTVTNILRELGAEVFDADRAGHEVLKMEHVKAAVRAYFSNAVFDAKGEVVRSELAKRVFGPTSAHRAALLQLEKISHPEIGLLFEKSRNQAAAAGVKALVLDAPLMIKAGWIEHCDKVLFVESSAESRLRRAIERGWTAQDFAAREAAQEPLSKKKQYASFVLQNDENLSQLRDQVVMFWDNQIDASPSN